MKTTKKSKALKFRKKVKTDMSTNKQYITTYKDIKKYFKELNSLVFNSELSPFNQIEIKDLRREKCVGQVVTMEWKRKGTRIFKLEMLPKYSTKKDFMDTLVHEMVHLYQMVNKGDTGNHNEMFYSFEGKVNYIGLDL